MFQYFEHIPETSLTPRDYQAQAIQETLRQFDAGVPGVLLRIPTGGGKTLTASLIAREWLNRGPDYAALVCAHERQLVWQFAQEIEDVLGIRPGIEMGNQSLSEWAMPRINVSCRASLYEKKWKDEEGKEQKFSRLEKFDPSKKWLVIADEAHRYKFGLKSCKHILEHFSQNPESRRLGITATPVRGDKISLARMFPGIGCDMRLADAVAKGWAVPYVQHFIVVQGVDFKKIKEIGGDFSDDALEAVLAKEEQLAKLCIPTLDLVGDRRTLIFSPTVAMAKEVAAFINARKPDSAYSLDGTIADEVRQEVYRRFKAGQFQFLSVCGLCVAKGTLVMTDCGEIPIEQVTTSMRLWDGVEFVSHGGVISKGKRPVIRYAGLTATGDHHVWTDSGWMRFAACKQQRIDIRVSAVGGSPVQESDGYYRGDHKTLEKSTWWPRGAVRRLRDAFRKGVQRTETRRCWLQELRKVIWGSELAADAVPICEEAMLQSKRRTLRRLWRSWDRVPLCFACENGLVDHGELGVAQGINAGSQGQQRPLRTRQHPLGEPDGTGEQQETEENRIPAEIEVFDILNAGPRHRFTASGLIVSNCREGFNDPQIGSVAVFRPTRSVGLSEQMRGRGSRTAPGTVDGLATAEERVAAIAKSQKPNCIAKGTLVLTDSGLVPIEQVALEMKVWDGVEFVDHCGTVSRGLKKVIDYCGLLATPDHEVMNHDESNWEPLWLCAAKQAAIRVTGVGGEAIREVDRTYRRGDANQIWQGHAAVLDVPVRLRGYRAQELRPAWERSRVQVLWKPKAGSALALEAVRECSTSVPVRKAPQLPFLREAWDQIWVPVHNGYGDLDTVAYRALQGADARPHRQQRQLRTWKYPLGDESHPGQQSSMPKDHAGDARIPPRLSRCDLCGQHDAEAAAPRIELAANSGEGAWGRNCAAAKAREVETFDIINAGPRHRFTAAGILVKNCIVVDLVGVTGLGDSATTARIMAEGKPDKVWQRAEEILLREATSGKGKDVQHALDEAEVELQIEQMEAEAKARARLEAQVRYSSHTLQSGHGLSSHTKTRRARWPFGKYKGQIVSSVPDWYIRWAVANVRSPAWLTAAIKEVYQNT